MRTWLNEPLEQHIHIEVEPDLPQEEARVGIMIDDSLLATYETEEEARMIAALLMRVLRSDVREASVWGKKE